jgi:hypothetical protein
MSHEYEQLALSKAVLREQSRLLRAWKACHAEERAAVLSGPHGRALAELFRIFTNLQHIQSAQLIGFVHSINWAVIDYDAKLVVDHELNVAITAFPEKHAFVPIDDGLPGEPDTPFHMIRSIVLTPSPHHEGAHRGAARSE